VNGTCRHTGKPHRWVRLGKITHHTVGRVVDWWQCRACGLIQDRDLPVGHA